MTASNCTFPYSNVLFVTYTYTCVYYMQNGIKALRIYKCIHLHDFREYAAFEMNRFNRALSTYK